jgi:hypothetical protein
LPPAINELSSFSPVWSSFRPSPPPPPPNFLVYPLNLVCISARMFASELQRRKLFMILSRWKYFRKNCLNPYTNRRRIWFEVQVNPRVKLTGFWTTGTRRGNDSLNIFKRLRIQSVRTISLGLFSRTKLFLLKLNPTSDWKKNQSERVTFQSNFTRFSIQRSISLFCYCGAREVSNLIGLEL